MFLKKETVCFTERLVAIYEYTRSHDPGNNIVIMIFNTIIIIIIAVRNSNLTRCIILF